MKMRRSKMSASSVMMIAWAISETMSRNDRPSSRATRLTGVTRERSMTPARSSAISPKPWNNPPKIGQQDQQARHKNLVRLGVGAHLQRRFEQRREQQQVHHRLEHADEDPDRVAQQ